MPSLAGLQHHGTGRGFTLIELLLTLLLLGLLIGATVFSFTTLQSGAELEEGALQVEALLRYARAYAANNGRQVQLNFEEAEADDFLVSLGSLRLIWEPDPLGQPGFYEDVPEASRYVADILELVEVESVTLLNPGESTATSATAESDSDDMAALEEELWPVSPPITFYPDGSSDSAEIILVSRAAEDKRRVSVRLSGLSGSVRRVFLSETIDGEPVEEPASENGPEMLEEPAVPVPDIPVPK